MRFRALLIGVMWLLVGTSHAASLTRTSSFAYDGAGLITKEVIEPDTSILCLVTTYGFDAFGNKTSATTRNCNASTGEAAAPTGDAVIDSRTSSTGFDAQGRFSTSATNALTHAETRTFTSAQSQGFGVATSLTGPNALTTTWTYDNFGRRTLETRADGNKTAWAYLFCSGVNGGTESCPTNGKYLVRVTPQNAAGSTNGAVSKVYYDALNREIRTETEGFAASSAVLKDTEYDSRGRVLRVSTPYYAGQSPVWTTFTYDDLNRVTVEALPATSSGTIRTETTYNGLTTTVTVSNNGSGTGLPGGLTQTKTTLKNSQGQVAQVTDSLGGTITYTYDPFGNLANTNAGGVVTTLTYNLRGHKLTMSEPNMGNWSYVHDVLGQLRRQTDAKAQVVTMAYDKLGRMTNRTEPDLISNWTYDTCTKGVGKLCQVTSDNTYARTHTYDSLGRRITAAETIGSVFTTAYTYNADGRLETTSYPSGNVIRNVYNARGYLAEVRQHATSALIWQAVTVSASGRVLEENLGNGLTTTRTYDTLERLGTVVTGTAGAVQNSTYSYDTIGNLSQRVDLTQANLTENFIYDRLNRLTSSSGSPNIVTRTITYNAIGNITHKSDVGTYTYGSSKPHAVTVAPGTTFSYDANGNMTFGAGRTLTYTSFNQPLHAAFADRSLDWTYNAEHQRTRQLVNRTTGTVTTLYVHPEGDGAISFEQDSNSSGVLQQRDYVRAGSRVIGIFVTPTANTLRYFHHDHLGSVVAVTSSTGTVLERFGYEGVGKRRFPNGSDDPKNSISGQNTDIGFTGHEHVDPLHWTNMNARMYYPQLSRFMSADPFVGDSTDLQSFNRYAYVNNRPTVFTDPTGHFKIGPIKFKLSQEVKVIAIAAASWYVGGLVSQWMISSATSGFVAGANGLSTALVTLGGEAGALTALGTGVSGAASGFTGGLLASGGDVEFALKSAVAVGLTAGLGQFGTELAGTPGSVAARSLGSGLSTQAFGGDLSAGIKNGLLAAFRSEAYAYMVSETDRLAMGYWARRGEMHFDEFGRPWTYGNRECESGSGSFCTTLFPNSLLLPTEYSTNPDVMDAWHTRLPILNSRLGQTPVAGAFLNSISKAHDWLNQTLTGVYVTNPLAVSYGAARNFGRFGNTIIDTVSTAGMLPAASFTARSLYANPLRARQP